MTELNISNYKEKAVMYLRVSSKGQEDGFSLKIAPDMKTKNWCHNKSNITKLGKGIISELVNINYTDEIVELGNIYRY